MLVASQWRSARLYQPGRLLARPCRLRPLAQTFHGLDDCKHKVQAASASTATANIEDSDYNAGHSYPSPDFMSASLLESTITTSPPGTVDSKATLRSYSQRLRRIKETPGREGVVELWNELKSREINITPTSIHGKLLWEEFLEVGLTKRFMREELWQYALGYKERTGNFYLGLYATIVSRFLSTGRPQLAYDWHKTIKDAYPTPKRSFFSLLMRPDFSIAHLSKTSNDILELIYKEGSDRNLYDIIVPSICAKGKYKRAFRWHNILLKHVDFPSPNVAQSPQIMAMFTDHVGANSPNTIVRDGLDASNGVSRDQSHIYSQAGNANRDIGQEKILDHQQPDLTREGMSRHLGDVHGIKEKLIDDDFCARLFATKILPVNIVINGLAAVGVDTLGPAALRELAVRASCRKGFRDSLDALEDASISVKACVYSDLIVRAAYEDSEDLFESVLTTDQHPEVFENFELQQKLLHSYIASKDWLQAHRTLMIIAIHRPIEQLQLSPTGAAWNFVLDSNTARARDPAVAHLYNQLLLNRIPVGDAALNSICQKYLKEYHSRRPDLYLGPNGRRSIADPADLSLAMNILLRSQVAIRSTSPYVWRGIMQRLGMLGRYRELARLSIWLTTIFPRRAADTKNNDAQLRVTAVPVSATSTSTGEDLDATTPVDHEATATVLPSPTSREKAPLDIIFSLSTQFSIVAWGVLGFLPRGEKIVAEKSADWFSNKQEPDCELWACGIKLLRILQESGAPIRTATVRRIVRDRLWMLFGTTNFTRWENRVASENNPYSLTHMVTHVNDVVWPGLFDNIAPFLLQGRTESAEDLFHTIFRPQLLKREAFWETAGKHRMLKWGTPFKTYRARLTTRRKVRRLSSVKGVKLDRAWYIRNRKQLRL